MKLIKFFIFLTLFITYCAHSHEVVKDWFFDRPIFFKYDSYPFNSEDSVLNVPDRTDFQQQISHLDF